VRALPHVAGFPDLRVLRPAPTAARPPKPLPGFAGYRPGIASRRPAGGRGRDGSPGFPRRPFARSTPNTPEGPSAPAPGTRAPSMAFAVHTPARHPLFPAHRRDRLTTLTQASLTLQTARSLRPASHPTSRSRTGASLPGTQASPRTGLTPAGHRELIAPTSCGPPCPHGARAVPAHAWDAAAARSAVTNRRDSGSGNGLRRPFTHGYGTGEVAPTQAPTASDDATALPGSCLWAHGGKASTLCDMRIWSRALAPGPC
jgi:hypothetical protein